MGTADDELALAPLARSTPRSPGGTAIKSMRATLGGSGILDLLREARVSASRLRTMLAAGPTEGERVAVSELLMIELLRAETAERLLRDVWRIPIKRPAAGHHAAEPGRNREIAQRLDEVGELLDVAGADVFRASAYRRAARTIATMPEDIETVWRYGKLEGIPGVGPTISRAIDEILRSGHLRYLERLERRVSPAIRELLTIRDIGPRRAQAIHDYLGITTISEVAQAAHEHRLQSLPRIGALLEARIGASAQRLVGADVPARIAA